MNSQSKLLIIAATLILLPQLGLQAGMQTSVSQSCNGNKMVGSTCGANVTQESKQKADVTVGLNKVGDKVTLNVGSKSVDGTFGKVTKTTTKEITLANPNQNLLQSTKLWTFIPTAANLGRLVKDKEQKLLFVSLDLNQPAPSWVDPKVQQEMSDYKTANPWAMYRVNVYVHIEGEPENQWTELIAFHIGDLKGKQLANVKGINFTIMPDAKISIQLPTIIDQNGNPITLPPTEGDLSKLG